MGGFLILLAVLLIVSAVVGLAVHFTRDPGTAAGSGARPATRFFLVILRLAIGWHFLIEGYDKLKSDSWTSEPYLREASGPAAPLFRSIAGDRIRDKLAVTDKKLPEPLAADWERYFDRFQSHYPLTDKQTELAKVAFEKEKEKAVTRLTVDKKVVAFRPVPGAPAPRMAELTVQQQIKAYDDKLKEVRRLESEELSSYGPSVFPRLQQAKAEANQIRSNLRAELTQQTALFKKTLQDVLTDEQKKLAPPTDPTRPPLTSWSLLDWSDFMVKYGLLATGVCLILGLFTRTFCVVGAGLLLMFFLAMPPLPGLPENPRAEGHYLYINKNIIEMVALLVLATTRSGRWAGLDAAIQALKNWCCPATPAVPRSVVTQTEIEESTEHLPPGDPRAASQASASGVKK